MTREQFVRAKTEIAKKALPHLVDPEGGGSAQLTMAECALLMSKDENHVLPPVFVGKIEKNALAKLGAELRAKGVTGAADCFPARRG